MKFLKRPIVIILLISFVSFGIVMAAVDFGKRQSPSDLTVSDTESESDEEAYDSIEGLLSENGLEYYAYMDLEKAPAELRSVILEARKRIILDSDWVGNDQWGCVLDEQGNTIATLPHFSDLFPEDWDVPNLG